MTVSALSNTETLSKTPTRVVRLPDPALAHMIRMRGQGYGWEDAAVYLRRQGILISNADIRRFFLGPKRTSGPLPGATRSEPEFPLGEGAET